MSTRQLTAADVSLAKARELLRGWLDRHPRCSQCSRVASMRTATSKAYAHVEPSYLCDDHGDIRNWCVALSSARLASDTEALLRRLDEEVPTQ